MSEPSPSKSAAAVSVRPGVVEDVAGLLALWAVAGENAGRPDDSAAAVRALLDRDPASVLVAEQDGRLVGSVIAGWDGWRAHLYRLAVHPDVRRQGVATALLERAESRLVALGAVRLDAMVLSDNVLGQQAWAARGYAPQQHWTRWVKPVSRPAD